MGIKHQKVLQNPDSGTEDKVYGVDWHAYHVIEDNTITDAMIAAHTSTKISLDAAKIISGRLSLSRLPTSATANRFLTVRAADADPVYDALLEADIPNLPASKITSGRFALARMPTSATANRFLVVRTANGDPVYDVLLADDIPSLTRSKISDFWASPFWASIPDKPSEYTPSSHGNEKHTSAFITQDDNARVKVRKNSGTDVGTRRRLNFIEGSNVTLTIADDPTDEEIDITIASTGGGSVYHNFLSDTHPDTLAASPVRGDIVVANSTPKWSRLAIGSSGQYLRSDGSDPHWAAIQATDLPSGIDASKISSGIVSNTEFDYLDGLTGNIQMQLNGKASTSHKDTHKAGGSDAFTSSDLLDAVARTTVRKNSGTDIGSRRRLNFIEGSNIILTISDDAANEQVNITIESAGGGGAGVLLTATGEVIF